jgi:cardiolipin synthase
MLQSRLQLIESAQKSLHIGMAYLGDRRFTRSLLAALARGVDVTLVTSARADVMGNINRATCNLLLRHAGGQGKLTVRLHPRVVHAKAIVIDRCKSDIGSANFTSLSHGIYDEVNLYVNDAGFAGQLADVLEQRANEGRHLQQPMATRKGVLLLEKAAVAYMSRRLIRPRPPQ